LFFSVSPSVEFLNIDASQHCRGRKHPQLPFAMLQGRRTNRAYRALLQVTAGKAIEPYARIAMQGRGKPIPGEYPTIAPLGAPGDSARPAFVLPLRLSPGLAEQRECLLGLFPQRVQQFEAEFFEGLLGDVLRLDTPG
jgi:hypothetical protein